MPRSSGKLRSSVLLDTGSSGIWEVQCLINTVSPQGECSQPWMPGLSDGQEAFIQQRKEIHCLSPFFFSFHPKACY